MMNRINQKWNFNQRKGWSRRLLAMISAFALLISSGGLAALAEPTDEVYSAPVTAPVDQPETSPADNGDAPDATPAPAETDPTGEGKTDGETEQPVEPEITPEPEDLTVYEAGSLSVEAEGIHVTLDYTAEARIPEGATLALNRAKGADLYSALKSAAKLLKNETDEAWNRELSEDDAVFYVLTLTDGEGTELHPTAGITLTCSDLNNPSDTVCFLTGDNARTLKVKNGKFTVENYTLDAFGYCRLKLTQTGTVTLTHNDRDYMVTASYGPEAGFPVGTELKVREIKPGTEEYALYSGMTDEALNGDWSEITLERYFDITFVCDGEELEPRADVDVQITFRDVIELNEEHDVQAVHIENNEATVINADTESNKAAKHDDEAIDTVSFSSDSFSVYGVVQRKKITKKVLAADGNTYEIEVTYGQEAEIPEGAEVKVEEIPEGSEKWEAYRKQTAAALNADDVSLPGLYDISIVDSDGSKIEPKAAVNVAIRLDRAEENKPIQIVHFTEDMPQELIEAESRSNEAVTEQREGQPENQSIVQLENLDGERPEEQKTEQTETIKQTEKPLQTIESETIIAAVEGDTITFDTQSFSVYAFAYTVDFHYTDSEGNLLEWSYPGRGQYPVTDILAAINGTGEIINVTLQLVEGELIDGALYLTQNEEKEWFLNSDIAFQDTYELTIYTSTSTYKLRVTDAATRLILKVNQTNWNVNAGRFADMWGSDLGEEHSTYDDGRWYAPIPYYNYRFVWWEADDGTYPPATTQTRANINARWLRADKISRDRDITCVAFFAPQDQYLVRVNWASPQGSGSTGSTVWWIRSVNCNTNNNAQLLYYYSGDIEKIIANPGDGYVFIGWYDNYNESTGTGTLISTEPELSMSSINRDVNLTPVFEGDINHRNYYNVWFDASNGINGGDKKGGGGANTYYSRKTGAGALDGTQCYTERVEVNKYYNNATITLPTSANLPRSSGTNHFELQGWYDVKANKLYAPGASVTITDDTVFYASWFPSDSSYSLSSGSNLLDTTDTSSFITTEVYDYNNLFNMQDLTLNSEKSVLNRIVNSEYWNLNSPAFIFMTADATFGTTLNPDTRDTANSNQEGRTAGLYSSALMGRLFGGNALGVKHVGSANYLYKYDSDTGYYYYDSTKNAAAYNKNAGRFYVYNYTNQTNAIGSTNDFLPFNYGNATFREDWAQVNYWFGMTSEVKFFLPNESGFVDEGKMTGNRSIKGDEMVYRFSGDDDVWVTVDGELVLDLGGVHGVVSGEINFSTGIVKVNGSPVLDDDGNPKNFGFEEGEHTLKLYYLERGASQSNCSIYFNLAPRHSMRITKKDSETGDGLGGATFGIYTDPDCTIPADLATYYGNTNTNEFTTGSDGLKHCKGLLAGHTYYIKELHAPAGYPDLSNELITLIIGSDGRPRVVTTPGISATVSSSEQSSSSSGQFMIYLTINNTQNPPKVKLRKIVPSSDGTNTAVRPIPGIHFQIYTEENYNNHDEPIDPATTGIDPSFYDADKQEFITSSEGKFYEGTIAPGTYYLVETEVPYGIKQQTSAIKLTIGFNKLSGKFYYSINDGNPKEKDPKEYYDVEIPNEIDTGSIQIEKAWIGGNDATAVLVTLGRIANDQDEGTVDASTLGLNAENVYSYNGVNYIKILKNDGGWQTLTVNGLPMLKAVRNSSVEAVYENYYYITEYAYIDSTGTVHPISEESDLSVEYNGTNTIEKLDHVTIKAQNANPDKLTVTNDTDQQVSIIVAKEWSDGNDKHTNDSVELKLIRYKKIESEGSEGGSSSGDEGGTTEPTTGTLNITHVSSGLTNTGLPEGFAVTYAYSGPDSNSGVAAGSYTVAAGTYTVTATVTNSAAPDGYTYSTTTAPITVDVPAGESASAEFTSVYSENTVSNVTYTLKFVSSENNLFVTYKYRQGTTVTITFDNNNPDYNPYDGIVLSGAVNGTISQGNNQFTITMNNDATITLSPTGYSNWSNVVTNALQLSPTPIADSSKNQNDFFGNMAKGGRHRASGGEGSVNYVTSNAPAGYEEDTSFNGSITLPYNNSWSYTFENLPVQDSKGNKYYYEIREVTSLADYEVTYDPDGPVMAEAGTMTFTATNTSTRPTTGNLTVSKTVTGNAGSTSQEFEFTVNLTGHTGEETFNTSKTASGTSTNGTITFSGETATFTLKHNESLTIMDLPADAAYSVTETAVEEYNTTTSGSPSGTIPAGDTASAAFFNNRNIGDGSLTITKQVAGDATEADLNKEFNITITILTEQDQTDTTFAGQHGDVSFTAGVGTVKLKHNQSATVSGLPYNTKYRISETYDDSYQQSNLYQQTVKVNDREPVKMPLVDRITGPSNVSIVVINTKLETVDIEATKVWPTGSLKATAVQFTLTRKAGDAGGFLTVDVATVTEADGWKASWTGLEKISNDGTTPYAYFVTETGIYFGDLDAQGNVPENGWVVPNIGKVDGGNLALDSERGIWTITITNTSKINVPIIKSWPDFSGSEFGWSAEFQLKYKEELVSGEADANAQLEWADVENARMPVEKGQTPAPQFENLDLYRVHANGSVYKQIYTVEETKYRVWKISDNTTVAQWEKGNEQAHVVYQGKDYEPYITQNAGEDTSIISLDSRYTIMVNNQPKDNYDDKLVIHKEWLDVQPEDLQYYPEVYVSLYYLEPNQAEADQAKLYNPDNNNAYKDYALNYDNNWTWVIDQLPAGNDQGNYRYFAVETPIATQQYQIRTYNSGIQVGRAIKIDSAHTMNSDKHLIKIDGYMVRDTYGQGAWKTVPYDPNNSTSFGYEEPHKAYVGNTGEILIQNRAPSDYMQLDVKKKFLEYRIDDNNVASLWTTTHESEVMNNMIIRIQLYRRIIDESGTYNPVEITPWEPYGNSFLIGYKANGDTYINNDNLFSVVSAEGTWAFRIPNTSQNQGLPRRGFYKKDNKLIAVRYQYLFKETEIYDGSLNKIGDEWSAWLPYLWDPITDTATKIKVFELQTAQDDDRILNSPGTSLTILKNWVGDYSGIEEIYVKVYRRQADSSGAGVDYTEEICKEMALGAISQDYMLGNPAGTLDETKKCLVLSAGNNWQATIHKVQILPITGGKQYEYYIEEVGYKDQSGVHTKEETEAHFTISYTRWDSTANDFVEMGTGLRLERDHSDHNKLAVTNISPYGALEVEKLVPGQSTEAAADQPFEISILLTPETGKTITETALTITGTGVSKQSFTSNSDGTYTLVLTITGPNMANIAGIPFGTAYEVSESDIPAGWKLSGIVCDDSVTPNVIASTDTEIDHVSVTNVETTHITVKKTWSGTVNWPDPKLTVQMTLKADGNDITYLPAYNGTEQTATVSLGSANAADGYTWYDLPKYGEGDQPIVYTVAETGMKYNGTVINNWTEIYTAGDAAKDNGIFTIDNTPVDTSIDVTKIWTLNGSSMANPPQQSIGFEVYQVVNGSAAKLNSVYTAVGNVTPELTSAPTVRYANGAWETVTVSGLPAYVLTESGYVQASYYVSETGVTGETKITYQAGNGAENEEASATAITDGTITIHNKDYQVSIDVLKIDESTRDTESVKPLQGAEFSLKRKGSDGYAAYPAEGTNIQTSGQDGRLTFNALPDGEYAIREEKSPAGYLGTNMEIFFRIENGIVTWTDNEGNAINSRQYVSYTPKTDTENSTFIVGNPAGSALPSTGGSGTMIYTISGLALIILAGTLMIIRKKRSA